MHHRSHGSLLDAVVGPFVPALAWLFFFVAIFYGSARTSRARCHVGGAVPRSGERIVFVFLIPFPAAPAAGAAFTLGLFHRVYELVAYADELNLLPGDFA